jgi:23S rRNA pseudouridine1911/1915/1917 synthase
MTRARDMTLFAAHPKTGRTHQIRVHLAESGYAIEGDALYGRDREPKSRMLLHALRLEFKHPVDGTAMCIECPAPKEFLRYT